MELQQRILGMAIEPTVRKIDQPHPNERKGYMFTDHKFARMMKGNRYRPNDELRMILRPIVEAFHGKFSKYDLLEAYCLQNVLTATIREKGAVSLAPANHAHSFRIHHGSYQEGGEIRKHVRRLHLSGTVPRSRLGMVQFAFKIYDIVANCMRLADGVVSVEATWNELHAHEIEAGVVEFVKIHAQRCGRKIGLTFIVCSERMPHWPASGLKHSVVCE